MASELKPRFVVAVDLDGDDRPLAHLIVHEDAPTKLFRKLSFTLSTRLDDRLRKPHWQMAVIRAKARLLR